jgi:hypothetical protein
MRSGRFDPSVASREGRLVGLLAPMLVLAALSTSACSSSTTPPSDPVAAAAAGAAARLEGRWVLIEFQPDAPLEPMLATWLASQMNVLHVTFHAGTMQIEGVGVDVSRSYRVTQAAADGFSLTIVDPTNVEYRATGAFQANLVAFTSLSDPWRGHGRLQRAP